MIVLKKSLALILSAILMLLCLTGYAAGFSDTAGTSYQNKAELLSVLDIMQANTGDTFGVNDEVTRGDFAVIVSKALGLSSIAGSSNKQVYIDVPPEHKAFSHLNILFAMGIMLGSPGASFRPDEIITYEEAVKTLIVATGYYSAAEAKGGYPVGYLVAGSQSGLLKGISLPAGIKMKKGDIASLVYNSILIDRFEADVRNGDMFSGRQSGENLLSQVFKVYKATGNVNAVGESSLKSVDSKAEKDCILIDETSYYIGKTSVADLLGMKIEFFYKKTSDDDYGTLVYIMEKDILNDIITAEANDILSATTVSEFIYYDDNENENKARIAESARFIYNGKLLAGVTYEDLKPEIGNVTLIDSNLDGEFETVIIKEYKNYVVDSVIPLDGVIRTRFTNEKLSFDIGGNNPNAYFYKDGFESDIASISQWTVISVLESKNITGNHIVSVYISQEKVTGTVTEVSNSGNSEHTVTLDTGETYNFSRSYIARAEAGLNGCSYPKAGEQLSFYLDIFGNIEAKYADVASSNNYGFLIAAHVGKGLSKNAELKIFTSKQTIEVFQTKDKVKVKNDVKTGEDILSALKNPSNPNEIKPQLIVYSTTSEGLINEYKTAEDKTSDTSYLPNEDDFVLSRKYEGKPIRIYKQLSYKDSLAVGKSTIVFDIPSDLSREKDYSVGRKFGIDESVKPPIYFYNVSNGGVIGVMVILSGGAASTKYNTPQVVESVTQAIDEEGEAKLKIYFSGGSSVLCNPSEITYASKWGYEDVKVSDLKEGDIIQTNLKDGEINALRVLVRANNIGNFRISEDDIVENGNQLSKVISVSDDKKFMVVEYIVDNAAKRETRQVAGSIRRYNSSTGKMESSAAADIQPGDTVFLNTFWLSTTMIVIYR